MNFEDYFYYDESSPTGLRYNRDIPRSKVSKGDHTGLSTGNTYYKVSIKGKFYQAHQVVWFLHGNEIPEGLELDHIDGDRLNNKIENLRLVTKSQNQWNTGKYISRNNGLPKGISLHRGGYLVQIGYLGKRYAKWHKDLDKAIAYSEELRASLHGEYTNNGGF